MIMATRKSARISVAFHSVVLAILIAAATARAQTTAFTFQGRLNDTGVPANGNYDMQLTLFDTATSGTGTQIGSTITLPGVKVTSGVFTVQLDFTAAAFTGADRFLEVGVAPAGSGNPFTILDPRQPITPTPYALFSLNATTATNATNATNAVNATNATNATTAMTATTATNSTELNGIDASQYVQTGDSRLTDSRPPTPGSSSYIQNTTSTQLGNFNISGTGTVGGILTANGKIGIGTTNPLRPLQVGPSADALFTLEPMDASPNAGYIRFGDNTGWKLHFGRSREKNQPAGGTPNTGTTGVLMTIQDNGNVGIGTTAPLAPLDVRGTLVASGNVGIGTTAPLSKLDVRGDVKLGSTGQFFAPGGEEDLRIIRGRIEEDVVTGAPRIAQGAGVFYITFNTPFSDTPTVTVTPDRTGYSTVLVAELDANCGCVPSHEIKIVIIDVSNSNGIDYPFDFIAIGSR
jgi:hypothetical protein